MSFSDYFSKQAQKPSGLFGRFIMSAVFDLGNAFLNNMVLEAMAIQNNDHVLDIGCGTGKLIRNMANHINEGAIEGIDFSASMVSVAQRKNRKQIDKGIVKVVEGDFDTAPYSDESFNKICSINTIYFWQKPEVTAKKIFNTLKPDGLLFLAFEDIHQLEQRGLNNDVFSFYTTDKVRDLLTESGFNAEIELISKTKSKLKFHCIVAKK